MRNGPSKHLGALCLCLLYALLDPPRAALDRIPFGARHSSSFSGVLFSGSRDKSLILPFRFYPFILLPLLVSAFACHRQRMEGLPSRGLYQLWTVSIYPPQRFYFHSHSIFPNSLISRYHCHLPPHMRPRPIPGVAPFSDSYLRLFILPILHSTRLPYPLIFPSISLSPILFALQRFYYRLWANKNDGIFKMD